METQVLRAVTTAGEVGDPTSPSPVVGKSDRPPARARAARPLPTDRMRFEQQVAALKAVSAASRQGQEPVSADDLATYIGLSPATAGLNNNWFADIGLVTRAAKGRYLPSDVTIEFARLHSWDTKQAGLLLAPVFRSTWFFDTARSRLQMGTTNREQLIRALAQVAGATVEHTGHLESLLHWLEYSGLIECREDGTVLLRDDGGEGPGPTGAPLAVPGTAAEIQATLPPPPPAAETGVEPAVLVFDFSLRLTAREVALLDSEQIESLYTAIGRLMAIKTAISD